MNSIAVYIGSFDPIHLGHIEVIEIALKIVGRVLILPNNPRKGKPNRKDLQFRAHCLGLVYPLFSSNDWMTPLTNTDKVVVDTRECDTVLNILRYCKTKIVGIIGSDVNSTKWSADSWIIVERVGYAVPANVRCTSTSIIIIDLHKTKYQHLSSTNVKQENLIDSVPASIVPYLGKKCNTLSRDTLDIVFETDKVSKTYTSLGYARMIGKNTLLVNSMASSTPFLVAELLEVKGATVVETLIPNEVP